MSDSYSLKFCREVASNPQRSGLSGRDWSKAKEENTIQYINDLFNVNILKHAMRLHCEINGVFRTINIRIQYDPNADFQYFTYSSHISDGRIYFIEDIYECLSNICAAQTYYSALPTPENDDTLVYTIGNFVTLGEEYGDYIPPNPEWK